MPNTSIVHESILGSLAEIEREMAQILDGCRGSSFRNALVFSCLLCCYYRSYDFVVCKPCKIAIKRTNLNEPDTM